MAGDWIKMRSGLTTCPKVAAMARSIGASEDLRGMPRQAVRLLVVGGLHAVWAAVNEHTSDGVMANACHEDLDDISGVPGFGKAMQSAGWLEVDVVAETLTFPNFGQWNTPAKDTTAAERMRKHREKQHVTRNTVTVTDPLRVTVTPDKTRQDKIREELPAAPVATSEPPKRRTRSRPDAAISWTADAGWQGITDTDRQEWRLAYPACDLAGELARATSWLRANPTKAHKSNWRKFVVGWLTRSQDRGGTNRTPGVRPDEKPPPKAFAGRDAQRFAATLAKAVTLTEEDLR
jgi:hypothetical protein